jgi:uncharacterized protein YndB with AHSA1/START domain
MDDQDVTREVLLEAEPEVVWSALTDPEELSEWLAADVEVDARPGGELTVTDGEGERTGFVEEADEPRRLSFWWSREGEDATRVELDLEEEAGGTLVRVTESRPLQDMELQVAELARRAGGGTGPQMLALAGA